MLFQVFSGFPYDHDGQPLHSTNFVASEHGTWKDNWFLVSGEAVDYESVDAPRDTEQALPFFYHEGASPIASARKRIYPTGRAFCYSRIYSPNLWRYSEYLPAGLRRSLAQL